jgi:hypothetical protein
MILRLLVAVAYLTCASADCLACSAQFEAVSNPLDDQMTTGFLGTGKAYLYMSDALVRTYNLTGEELSRLQYYVSKDITFSHEVTDGSREVAHGKLVLRNGKAVNEIFIAELTPGIAVDSRKLGSTTTLAVSFEDGTSLEFSSQASAKNSRMCLAGNSWQADSCDARVYFDKASFWTSNDSGDSCLLIDKDALSKFQKSRKVLPGRLLPGADEN